MNYKVYVYTEAAIGEGITTTIQYNCGIYKLHEHLVNKFKLLVTRFNEDYIKYIDLENMTTKEQEFLEDNAPQILEWFYNQYDHFSTVIQIHRNFS